MKIMSIGARIKNIIIFPFKFISRSIVNHPFFIIFLVFLCFLNKFSPFLFYQFVHASPILVSTTVLIGTLLTYGQCSLHQTENKRIGNRSTSNFVSLKAGVSLDEPSIGESYGMKRHSHGKGTDGFEKHNRDFEPLINEREIKSQKSVSDFEIKGERDWVVLENYCSTDGNKNISFDSRNRRSQVEHIDNRLGRKIESSRRNSVRDEASDIVSDGDESVSQNPSMVDFIPLIDDMDGPLLDVNGHHRALKSQESSNYGADESSDDTSEDEDFGEEDKDDEDEEESGKGGENKSVFTWSEDDRKNVANLGTIELERNERLESVIARRRWKRLMAEKSLLDFDSTDFATNNVTPTTNNVTPTTNNVAPTTNNFTPIAINVAAVSSSKQNPFDLPQMPGSAPSLKQPRSNPFDLPSQINEERSVPQVDTSHRGLQAFPLREMAFRRHESFSVGPSFFGESLLDELSTFPPKEVSFRRHESFRVGPSYGSKHKPYFVTERMGFEGSNYSPMGRRSSDMSESIASSIPETESVSSDEDKVSNGEFSHEPEQISNLDDFFKLVEHGSESSDDEEALELNQAEKTKISHDGANLKVGVVNSNVKAGFIIPETADEVNSKQTSLPPIQVKIPDNDKEEMIFESRANSPTELNKEPVYDSSPRGIHKDHSSSSMSSEVDVILPEGEAPVLVKRTSFAYREANMSTENTEIDTPVNGEEKKTMQVSSSENKSVVTDSVDKAAVLQKNPTTDEKLEGSTDEKLPGSTDKKLEGSNVDTENSDIGTPVNGEKKPMQVSSFENKFVVTDSVDKAAILQKNPDRAQSSTTDEKLQGSTDKKLEGSNMGTENNDISTSVNGEKKTVQASSSENKSVVTDSVDKAAVVQKNPTTDEKLDGSTDEKLPGSTDKKLEGSNMDTENSDIGTPVNGEKKPMQVSSFENKSVVTDSVDKAAVLQKNLDQTQSSTTDEKLQGSTHSKLQGSTDKKLQGSTDEKLQGSNMGTGNNEIGTPVNEEKKPMQASSSENKSDVKESVDKTAVLQKNPDRAQLSTTDEKLQGSTDLKVSADLSSMGSQENIKETSTRTVGEQLPSSDKAAIAKSLEVQDKLPEKAPVTKTEAVVAPTVSHDSEQKDTKKIGKTKNDGDIKSSSDLNIEGKSNSTENSTDVSSVHVADHQKDKTEANKSISHDHKHENIKEIGKSKNDGDIKSSLELNTKRETKPTTNSAEVSSLNISDHGKDKEGKKSITHVHEEEKSKETETSKKDGEIKRGSELNVKKESNLTPHSSELSSESVSGHGKDKGENKSTSHDHEKENVKEIGKSKNEGDIKSDLELNTNRESNMTAKSNDVSSLSVADFSKDKKENKQAIGKSKNEGEIKNDLDLNTKGESNTTANSNDVASLRVADLGKYKEKEKKSILHLNKQENEPDMGKTKNDEEIKDSLELNTKKESNVMAHLTEVPSLSVELSSKGSQVVEQMPPSDKPMAKKPSEVHENLQEKPSSIKMEDVMDPNISQDREQKDIKENRSSKPDVESKSSPELNIKNESNPTTHSTKAPSTSDSGHSEDKNEKKSISNDQKQENNKETAKSGNDGQIKSGSELNTKKESTKSANSEASSLEMADFDIDKEEEKKNSNSEEKTKEFGQLKNDEEIKNSSKLNIKKESNPTSS